MIQPLVICAFILSVSGQGFGGFGGDDDWSGDALVGIGSAPSEFNPLKGLSFITNVCVQECQKNYSSPHANPLDALLTSQCVNNSMLLNCLGECKDIDLILNQYCVKKNGVEGAIDINVNTTLIQDGCDYFSTDTDCLLLLKDIEDNEDLVMAIRDELKLFTERKEYQMNATDQCQSTLSSLITSLTKAYEKEDPYRRTQSDKGDDDDSSAVVKTVSLMLISICWFIVAWL